MRLVAALPSWMVLLAGCLPAAPLAPADIDRVPVSDQFHADALQAVLDAVAVQTHGVDPSGMPIAVITTGSSDTLWKSITTGATRAAAELGVPWRIQGAIDSQQTAVLSEIAAATPKYAGVAVAPTNSASSTVAAIDAVHDGGATVLTLESDVPTSARTYCVGAQEYEAGKTAAESLIAALGPSATGTVIVVGTASSVLPGGRERTRGATETLRAAGLATVLVDSGFAVANRAVETELQYCQDNPVCDYLVIKRALSQPNLTGVVCLWSISYLCGEALQALGLAGTVKATAFEAEPETLSLTAAGTFLATHVPRGIYIGKLAVYLPFAVQALGKDAADALLGAFLVGSTVNTGLDVVTTENTSAYIDYLNELGVQ
jgi:ABC-type sugar transport system substrate-binding protein